MELVTTNSYDRQLFRLLPPGWEEFVANNLYKDYQWRFGMNPESGDWSDSIIIGDIVNACWNLKRQDKPNIHQYTLCWVGVPQKSAQEGLIYISAKRAVIYRAMTVDELRKTDDPMYRVVIACAINADSDVIRDISLVTEIECIYYIMNISSCDDLIEIPQYARTGVVYFFARIMYPNNTIITTNLTVVELLATTMSNCHYPFEWLTSFNEMYILDHVGKPAIEIVFDLIARVSSQLSGGID